MLMVISNRVHSVLMVISFTDNGNSAMLKLSVMY